MQLLGAQVHFVIVYHRVERNTDTCDGRSAVDLSPQIWREAPKQHYIGTAMVYSNAMQYKKPP